MKKIKEYNELDVIRVVRLTGLLHLGIWFITRPCTLRPFSKHDCSCEGYKNVQGSYPKDCGH